VAEEFVGLGQALLQAPPGSGVVDVLRRVVSTAAAVVPAADVVSVTLREADGTFHTPAATSPHAERADRIQFETGEGPCVAATAVEGLGWSASADLAGDPRFPMFGPPAAELGLRAVFATGMFPGGVPPRLGALNYYSFTARGLDDVDRDVALILASYAAVALHSARQVAAERLRSTELQQALQARDVIGQAKGILMQRRGCTADEAFGVLRQASQDLNVKLREIAQVVAERRAEL
jgi:GAF domain-containing protein